MKQLVDTNTGECVKAQSYVRVSRRIWWFHLQFVDGVCVGVDTLPFCV